MTNVTPIVIHHTYCHRANSFLFVFSSKSNIANMTETLLPPVDTRKIEQRIAQLQEQLLYLTPGAAGVVAVELNILQNLADCQSPPNNGTMDS